MKNWVYKPSQYDPNTFEGSAALDDVPEAWLSFMTSDSEAVVREKIAGIVKWVYENDPVLKEHTVSKGVHEEWGADTEYSEQQFIQALNLQEISINQDYSFSVVFVPDEGGGLFEIMGYGHGPYIEVAGDYTLGNIGFTG